MSEIDLTAEQAALYPTCVRFVSEQACGEWGQELIYADAKKLALVMDEVRIAARERAFAAVKVYCEANKDGRCGEYGEYALGVTDAMQSIIDAIEDGEIAGIQLPNPPAQAISDT